MKWALLGGWGYLGANLVDLLPSCVIARRSSAERRPFLKNVFEDKEVYLLEEINEKSLREALENCGADALFYLIGKLKGKKEEMYEAHVTKAILAAKVAKEMDLRFVYTSSIAAMGLADACERGGIVYEEEEHLKGCEPLGPYSETKALGEREVLKAYPGAGIVRPSAIVGKYGYYVEWKFLDLAKRKGVPVPNLSAVTPECVAKAAEEALKGGWVIASNLTLKDLGFKTFEWRPPKSLVRLVPGFMKVALIAMRYRYSSRRANC